MPNHIKNRLTFSGDQSKIDELIARYSTVHPAHQRSSCDGELTFCNAEGNYGWLAKSGSFSFRQNGVIVQVAQMPDGYEPSINPEWRQFPDFRKVIAPPDDPAYRDEPNQQVAERSPNWWYSWNQKNWGTKWNAYACKQNGENVWEFDTAWSGVPELINEIANSFPEINILYEYSDEDTGSNVGSIVFRNGSIEEAEIEDCSIQAYKLAFKLRPEYAENYHLVNGKYEYKDEDEE